MACNHGKMENITEISGYIEMTYPTYSPFANFRDQLDIQRRHGGINCASMLALQTGNPLFTQTQAEQSATAD